MADLLGSLLPSGYSAPDVQSILGGNLLDSICSTPGSNPIAKCGGGSSPVSECSPQGGGGGGGGEPAYCTPYGQSPPGDPSACVSVGYEP